VTAIAMVIEVSPCPITADSEMAGGRLGSAMNPKSRTRQTECLPSYCGPVT